MPGPGGATRQAKTLRKQRKRRQVAGPPTPTPRAPAFGPISGQAKPFSRAQKQARKRTEKAQSRLPARPTPSIPVLKHPTRQQTAAANHLVARSVARQVAPGSGKQRQTQRDQIVRELKSDPRYRRALRAAQYYAAAEQRDLLARGVPQRNARDRASAGPAHRKVGIGPASIDTTALGRAVLGATSLDTPSAANQFVRAALGDLKGLGSAPFIGGYEIARGGYEAAAHGDTKRLERLAKGVGEGISQSVPGRLVSGDPEGAAKSFREHPLYAALDLAAGAGAVGRVAGGVARTTSGYRLGSTVRSPLAQTLDAGAVKAGAYTEREGSKDLLRRTVQAGADARREPIRDAEGKVVTVKQRGRDVPVLKPTPSEMKRANQREGNVRAGRANAVERLRREVVARELKSRGIRGKRAKDLVAMAVEGTITSGKHFKADLEAHAKRLDREYARRTREDPKGYRHSGEAQLNRERAGLARDAAADPRVVKQGHKIVAEGERIGTKLNALEGEAKTARVISDEARARRSGLIPAAIEHKGARFYSEAEHAKLEKAALAHERSLPEGSPERAAAREERIAVSGRHPEQVKAHEAARAEAEGHRAFERKARARVASLEHARQRMIGRHQKARGARQAALKETQERATRELAATDQGIRLIQGRLDAAEKQLARHDVSMRRASDRGDMAKMEEIQGHVELLSQKRAELKKQVAGLHRQRGIIERAAKKAQVRASEGERKTLAKHDAAIKSARAEAVRRGKDARAAEHKSRQTPMPKIKAAVRYEGGRHLPNEHIEDFLRSRGRDPGTVAYLPHVPPGNRAFHAQFRPGSRPVIDKAGPDGRRTGEAYRKGATSASADLIQQQGVKLTTQITKAEQLDSLVRERGLKHPEYAAIEKKAQDGGQLSKRERRLLDAHGNFTGREAREYAQRIEFDTSTGRDVLISRNGERLVPMTAFADRLSRETKRIISEDLQGPGGMESLHQHLLNDRIIDPNDLGKQSARNVVLVNADLIDRLEAHLRPAGEIERFVQMLNRPFRFAVLAQPRWLTGNFVEPYLVRLPTVGSGAINVFGLGNDIRIAGKVVKAAKRSKDPRVRQVAEELEAQHLGGLFIGGRGASNRRLFEDTQVYAKMVAKVPAVRQMYDLTHKLGSVLIAPGRAYFWANRQGIERWAQKAALGRSARRDMVEFFGNWQKATRFGEQAAAEAAKGLVNTPTQLRFLKEQHKLLGQYGDFGPRLRRAVQGPMPFLPWALNSARFVYWTMPTQRTLQTALLIKTQQVVAGEWAQEHSDLPPSLQKTTLGFDARRKDGGFTPGIRYTPYGLTAPSAEGELEGLDQALPAFQGPINALVRGQDPFGNPLKTTPSPDNPKGTVEGLLPKGTVAANQLAEALIPYVSQLRRLRERGETSLPTSNLIHPKTKPGTSHGMSAARRTFDPFRPTYVRAGGGGGPIPALSRKAARDLGLDKADLEELRQATAGQGLDKADLEELRQLARGGP